MNVDKAQTAYKYTPAKPFSERANARPITTPNYSVQGPTPPAAKDYDQDALGGQKQVKKFWDPYSQAASSVPDNTFDGKPAQQAPQSQPPNGQVSNDIDWTKPQNYLNYLKGANPEAYSSALRQIDPEKYADMVVAKYKSQLTADRRAQSTLLSQKFMNDIMGLNFEQ